MAWVDDGAWLAGDGSVRRKDVESGYRRVALDHWPLKLLVRAFSTDHRSAACWCSGKCHGSNGNSSNRRGPETFRASIHAAHPNSRQEDTLIALCQVLMSKVDELKTRLATAAPDAHGSESRWREGPASLSVAAAVCRYPNWFLRLSGGRFDVHQVLVFGKLVLAVAWWCDVSPWFSVWC